MSEVIPERWKKKYAECKPNLYSPPIVMSLIEELGAAEHQRDAALAMLRRLEWDWLNCCPICIDPDPTVYKPIGRRDTGHEPGCELAKLLEGK